MSDEWEDLVGSGISSTAMEKVYENSEIKMYLNRF